MEDERIVETLQDAQRRTTREDVEYGILDRLNLELKYWNHQPPREVIVAWQAYLQSVDEWAPAATAVQIAQYRSMLPKTDDNAVALIAATRSQHLSDLQRRNVTMLQVEADVVPRLRLHLDEHAMHPPREVVIAWNGYIQALAEWSPGSSGNIIPRLRGMLPPIANDPAEAIADGRL
ncbi:MAG: hypothetical protein NVS4B5_22100 [Vulcanimicrobiaceae bacterium]